MVLFWFATISLRGSLSVLNFMSATCNVTHSEVSSHFNYRVILTASTCKLQSCTNIVFDYPCHGALDFNTTPCKTVFTGCTELPPFRAFVLKWLQQGLVGGQSPMCLGQYAVQCPVSDVVASLWLCVMCV